MKRIYSLLVLLFLLASTYTISAGATETLITNGDFENGKTGWLGTGGKDSNGTPYITVSDVVKHSGNASIKVSDIANKQPYIYQDVTVTPDTEYTLTFWAYAEKLASVRTLGFKFEYYQTKTGGHLGLDDYGRLKVPTENMKKWIQYEINFVTPENCYRVNPLLRLYGAGEVYFDDVSIASKGAPKRIIITNTDIFNYTDAESGSVEIRLNTASYTPSASAYIKVFIEDGNKTVHESGNIYPVDGAAKYSFPVSALEENKTYVLSAVLYDGDITATAAQNIYKVARPSILGKDGTAYIDGKPFYPVLAYHVNYGNTGQLDDVSDIGVNLVQCPYTSPNGAYSYLEAAKQYGIKVLVPLYANMLPAGHPDNLQNTIEVVNRIKDHEALFGYIMIDEPYAQVHRPGTYLEEGYKLIRSLDKKHIITFVNDKPLRNQESAQYADVLMIDPYIWDTQSPANYVAQRTKAAVECGKPVYVLVQASNLSYFPEGEEVRSMCYQAMLSGAKGAGYYSVYDTTTNNGSKVPMMDTKLWEPLCTFSKEIKSVQSILNADNIISEEICGNFYVHRWTRDGQKYVAIRNSAWTKGAAFSTLAKTDSVPIGNYAVSVVSGNPQINGFTDGMLSVKLSYCDVCILKLTDFPAFTRENQVIETISPGNTKAHFSENVHIAVAFYKETAGKSEMIHFENSKGLTNEFSFIIPEENVTLVRAFFYKENGKILKCESIYLW